MSPLPEAPASFSWGTWFADVDNDGDSDLHVATDAGKVDHLYRNDGGSFTEISAIRGAGSQSARRERLASLFARATVEERDFLARLILGELRQGALEGLQTDALDMSDWFFMPASRLSMEHPGRGAPSQVADRTQALE